MGIATAKTLAHELGRPIVGVATAAALLPPPRADGIARHGVLLLPAGPSDRILVRAGAAPALLPADRGPSSDPADVAGRGRPRRPRPAEALRPWRVGARRGWPRRSSGSAAARLGRGDVDDLARLVPDYVTLPRGVAAIERGGGMVARPPVRLRIEPMRIDDLVAVHAIERASFAAPWPTNAYRSELETNRLAHYLVARVEDEVVGYGGMWLMVDEAHITTFAVDPAWRRQRIGERLLLALLDLAIDRRAREATLEVRLSNMPARRLYEKYGFRPVGLRPRYYTDDGEDALIMTTEALTGPSMRDRIERLRAELEPRRRRSTRRPGDAGAPRPGRPGRPRWRRA